MLDMEKLLAGEAAQNYPSLREYLKGLPQSEDMDFVIEILRRHELVQIDPGQYVEVRSLPGAAPTLLAKREEDGSISLKSRDSLGKVLLLRGDQKAHSRELSQSFPKCGQSVIREAVRTVTHQRVCQHQDLCHQLPYDLICHDSEIQKEIKRRLDAEQLRQLDDTSVDRRIQEGIEGLLDQETLALCRKLAPRQPVYVNEYNHAARNKRPLRSLLKTNPGAAAWHFHRVRDQAALAQETVPFNHPGQIITRLKEYMQASAQLTPQEWKTMSSASTPDVSYLLNTYGEPEAARIIGLFPAGNLRKIPKTVIKEISALRTYEDHMTNSHPVLSARASPKLGKMVLTEYYRKASEKAVPPSAVQREMLDQFSYVKDWVTHAIIPVSSNGYAPQDTLTAKSWKGCMKAARRWHDLKAQENREKKQQQLLQRNGGTYLAWNNLVEQQVKGQVTISALSDEAALIDEAIEMKHCVDTYGPRCAEGKSRVFRVCQGRTHCGTVELGLGENQKWKVYQFQGYKTGRRADDEIGSDEIESAVFALEKEYNRLWQEAGGNAALHFTWRANPADIDPEQLHEA